MLQIRNDLSSLNHAEHSISMVKLHLNKTERRSSLLRDFSFSGGHCRPVSLRSMPAEIVWRYLTTPVSPPCGHDAYHVHAVPKPGVERSDTKPMLKLSPIYWLPLLGSTSKSIFLSRKDKPPILLRRSGVWC